MDKIHVIDQDWKTNQAEDFIDKLRKKKDSIVVFYTHTQEFTETNKDINKGIVLWHIPSKKDIKNLKEYCDINQEKILFIGKSGLSDIRKEAKKAKLFKLVVGSFDTTKIKSCFMLDKSPLDFNSIYNCLSGESKKAEIDKTIYQILHFFLPLDIDMQALKTTKNPEAYLNDIYSDLEELYKDGSIDKHYRQKLYDLWYLLKPSKENERRASPEAKKLTSIDNPPDALLKIAGLGNKIPKESPIYQFLESLDKRKKDGNDLKEKVDYLLAPFKSSGLKIGDNEIKSFHNWYCALASCLKGEEACK